MGKYSAEWEKRNRTLRILATEDVFLGSEDHYGATKVHFETDLSTYPGNNYLSLVGQMLYFHNALSNRAYQKGKTVFVPDPSWDNNNK